MKSKKIPLRRCVGCMESKPKKELIRLTLESGRPKIDPGGKSNGRGIYICRDMECLSKAGKRKSIERGLGAGALTDEEKKLLREEFEKQISNMEVAE